jgi:toxin ParE1/3/4
VARSRFSRLAEADLLEIATYTLNTWGEDQAAEYIDGMEEICQRLAENTHMGRACDHIRPGLRRIESGLHVSSIELMTPAC